MSKINMLVLNLQSAEETQSVWLDSDLGVVKGKVDMLDILYQLSSHAMQTAYTSDLVLVPGAWCSTLQPFLSV